MIIDKMKQTDNAKNMLLVELVLPLWKPFFLPIAGQEKIILP